MENSIFSNKGQLAIEAKNINKKAQNICIKQVGKIVKYVVHPMTGKFARIELIPEDYPEYRVSSPTFRKDKIDLSIPRKIAKYDKFGYRLIIKSIKTHIFGNRNVRITKRKAETFFNDNSNFDY